MCQDFDARIEEVVQMLNILAPASRQIARLREFLGTQLPPGFPVKLGKDGWMDGWMDGWDFGVCSVIDPISCAIISVVN
jgi:hypothetical protein